MIPTDPLESLPLPPGDPGALADEARQMADWSVALGDCGDHQERAVAAIAGSTWKGLGAASARGGAHQVIGGYRQAGHALTRAGALLQGCAQDWDGARSRYAQARMVADEALYDEARHAMASPSCLATPPASPWESPLRHHAQALARAAIDDFDAAANRTARELQELAGDIGRTPAFLPRHHHHWYEDPLQWAADGEHLVANGVSHAFDPFRYALSHPGDALQVASDALQAGGGLALTAAGGVGFGAGVLLDGSVIGIPAGVAVDATSAAAVAGGAALSIHGVTNGLGDISNLYSKSTSGDGSSTDVSGAPKEISGYSNHGFDQVMGRDGGLGVSDSAMEGAIESPIKVVQQSNNTFKFIGKNATVVLNRSGKLVTAWANNTSGLRNRP